MLYTEKDIAYEQGNYWVLRLPSGQYEVYKIGITHSVRCAQIGHKGEEGLNKAKSEIERRIAVDTSKHSG